MNADQAFISDPADPNREALALTSDEVALALKSVETRIRMMEDGLLPSMEDTYPDLCALAEKLALADGLDRAR